MTLAVAPTMTDRGLSETMDLARTTMDSEMNDLRNRLSAYLNWYSPPWNNAIARHDAWEEPIDLGTDMGLTRDNFPIVRACVDIWTSLEASSPATMRAEAERISPPPPSVDENEVLAGRRMYDVMRQVESIKADVRSARIRSQLRRDQFSLKNYTATRRKNLYGFTWQKVLPAWGKKRSKSHVVRDPSTVYPLWSSREPGELDAVLACYKMSVTKANAKYGLGIRLRNDRTGAVDFARGDDSGKYREINDRWYDSTRTMVWVEEFWWIDEQYNARGELLENETRVHMATRVCDRIVESYDFAWQHIPWVYWENTDERDSYGWSDVAGVIDINDEINRRISQQGDIIGMYASPRFQLLGSTVNADIEMPGPFELVPLQDTERIEQILARIDAYPAQVHFQFLTQELLPRCSGLPPIVWGLINNAQTSGRALTASWKATETRLSPKLMRNEQSLIRYLEIHLDYARVYDWDGSRTVFTGLDGNWFEDFRINFPPMEPRDFTEVTQDAIFRRDAGLTTTIRAMRDTGVEDAEDLEEEVLAEFMNVFQHPDKVQAYLLAKRAELDNQQYEAQLNAPPQQPSPPPGAPAGAPGSLPPGTQAAAPSPLPAGGPPSNVPPGAAGVPPIQTSTMQQGADITNRFLTKGQVG